MRRDTIILIAVVALWTVLMTALAQAMQIGYVDHDAVEPSDAAVGIVLVGGLWLVGVGLAYIGWAWRRRSS